MIKLCIKLCMRTLLRLTYPFWKVKNNQIVFESYGGKQISCNPYYIWQELQRQHPEWKYIWIYDGNNHLSNACCINKCNLIKYFYVVMTSKVYIANLNSPTYIPFRKSQIIINTWHGGGAYKKIDGNRSLATRIHHRLDSKNCSFVVSTNQMFTRVISKTFLINETRFLPIGQPRNDIFFDQTKVNSYNEKIRKKYSIKIDDFIVLYAPTYRDYNRLFTSFIDISRLKKAVYNRFGKQCKFLVRGHHYLSAVKFGEGNDMLLDVSQYPYMQELLCATDMLISDYSSCIWDYSFLYRPCVLFSQDLQDYKLNRNFYVPIESWGFPIATTMTELAKIIEEFNEEDFIQRMNGHHQDLGSYENGTATESICHLISSYIPQIL